jgi:hypothetical protein
MAGESRTSFCSGSSMFSKVELGRSADVYAEIMAAVKVEAEERRYCSTRAVSSWSLLRVSVYYSQKKRGGHVPYEDSIQGRYRPVAVA